MSTKIQFGAQSAFKKTKRPLKPWEEVAQEMARKTEKLRALRLAKEASDREAKALKTSKAAAATKAVKTDD